MSRARSVADLGNQNVLSVSATNGNINVGTGVTLENTGEAQFSGIVTAPSIDTRNLIGNVSIGGVLTYEDVTSVDSVGIVTARQGIHVLSGISTFAGITTVTGETLFTKQLNVSGVSTLGSNVVVGGATTELVVTGDARVTGILTVGTASLTLDGATGNVSGASLHDTQISAISKDITDAGTVVDVFVYDTSKDSDGGAWRKRTKHTSWYNETLNTATRGSRKEFPAVAVIVTETTKVTIYDGDDPDLPMWMAFTWVGTSPLSALGYNNRPKSATTMINGQLVTCGDPDGVHVARFIHDDVIRTTHSVKVKTTDAISKRTNSMEPVTVATGSQFFIVSSNCNDVAVTVLPNAPVDSATGLPRPTIAVATDGGVSVITDDGTVVDISESAGSAYVGKVNFREDKKLGFFTSGNAGPNGYPQPYYIDIPSSDLSVNYFYNITQGNIEKYGGTAWESNSVDRLLLHNEGTSPQNSNLTDIVDTSNLTYAATNQGLNAIIRPKVFGTPNAGRANMLSGAVAYIQNDYNTGYMVGDIKGAFLSDTDTTDTAVAYSDGFSNNDKGWGFVDCSITSGNLVITQQGQARATDLDALDGIATGTKLVFTFTVSGSGTGDVLFDDDGAGAGVGGNTNYGSFSSTGSYIFTTTKTASPRLRFIRQNGSNDYEITFINITTEYDRSVNNKGLTSNGTVNKSVVATGAELVGYGPFSSANYVKQLYNSDMNFGTGDFSITWWHYMIGDVSNAEYVYDRAGGSGYRHAVYYTANDSGRITFYTDGQSVSNETTSEIFVNGINSYKDQWTCYTVTRSGSSGDMAIYINGEVGHYAPAMVIRNLDNTSAELYIGVRHNETGAASQAKYALMRFFKSMPSAEQIKKMYEDEKHLFRENAKATLYGSSDAVTALAYDEDTELLHVGTSAGRSEFQGLCRINNTTDPVTAAISASNDLVAEK